MAAYNQNGFGLAYKRWQTKDSQMESRTDVVELFGLMVQSCHDITLSRGCLIAGLPPILAEGAGHHYKSMGWSLFYEIT